MIKKKTAEEETTPDLTFPGLRIVSIEDEKSLRDCYRMLFEEAGYSCLTFASAAPPNAQNIIAAIHEFKPHIITTGLEQPGMSGEEIIFAIRAQIVEPIPIIVITGKADTETIERVFKLGVNDFVLKPFKPKDLFSTIERNIKKLCGELSELGERHSVPQES